MGGYCTLPRAISQLLIRATPFCDITYVRKSVFKFNSHMKIQPYPIPHEYIVAHEINESYQSIY